MSHFAQVVNGSVQQVIVAEQDFIDSLQDKENWIQTSYNTIRGQHILGKTSLRGNYAGVGYVYDKDHDVFYEPKPYASWVLNQTTWTWESPTPEPNDGKQYIWDEAKLAWTPLPADN